MEVFMRSISFAALVLALVLAGCGSQQQPTATAIPPTAVPPTNPVVGQGDNALATLAATIGAPQPGTLVIPQETQGANISTPAPIAINNVIFTQTGGIAHISLSIELDADGTLIRDGKTTKVSQDDVQKIETMLDGIHFFNLQGIFVSPAGTGDAYLYSLSVSAKTGSRTVTSQDGMTPPELGQIYDALRALNNG
jgi:hypothetical protein